MNLSKINWPTIGLAVEVEADTFSLVDLEPSNGEKPIGFKANKLG